MMAQPDQDAATSPSRRQQLAPIAQALREIRDEIERINDPYDADLGAIHARVAVIVNDVRSLSAPRPSHVERFGGGTILLTGGSTGEGDGW